MRSRLISLSSRYEVLLYVAKGYDIGIRSVAMAYVARIHFSREFEGVIRTRAALAFKTLGSEH